MSGDGRTLDDLEEALRSAVGEREGEFDTGLSIDAIGYPAYFLSRRCEIEWINTEAERIFFAIPLRYIPCALDRNIFKLFFERSFLSEIRNSESILAEHVRVIKGDIPAPEDDPFLKNYANRDGNLLIRLWDQVESSKKSFLMRKELVVNHTSLGDLSFNMISLFFREGILVIHVPQTVKLDAITDLLLGRRKLIRDLMLRRLPSLNTMTVLVADLEDSVKISAQMLPHEYFMLINEIWAKLGHIFKKFDAIAGKHAGDGIVRFFLADERKTTRYVISALLCAVEIRKEMKQISNEWKTRKNWSNEIVLNIGIHEGREWFGQVPSPMGSEFTALGDTVNIAARISDFAQDGSIWVSKHLISILSPAEAEKIKYGIRHLDSKGEIWIANAFSRVSDMVDISLAENVKKRDIATLPVAEILDIDYDALSGGTS